MMININNKSWDKLRFFDIKMLLSQADDESFFFEFKADDESPAKLAKEISAFSNTYGGYILLGVNNDKSIGGCQKWTEQRIHATVHDSITPVPNFDVKKFRHDGKIIFVIKIEEGSMPPYITNKGQIFERISSGSFPINESSKLSQLYNKRNDQLAKIRRKIEFNEVTVDTQFPNNVHGILEMGFSMTCSEPTKLQKNFTDMDLTPVAEYLRSTGNDFSISRVGNSYVIGLGRVSIKNSNGKDILPSAGLNNYIEIMWDGSVKCRILLSSDPGESKVDISNVDFVHTIFLTLYSMFFGSDFHKIFIYAHKYEQLVVLKQFVPYYAYSQSGASESVVALRKRLAIHQSKYGDNLIIDSDRVPKNDYILIDKQAFDLYKVRFNTENLFHLLFSSYFFDLGFIDAIE